jgi:hypothetical protein
MASLKNNEEKWHEENKKLEDQNFEFLSDFDKHKRQIYQEGKNKLYSVINRRTNQWNEQEEERKKLSTNDISTETAEYYFYREETTKFEEKIISSGDNNY